MAKFPFMFGVPTTCASARWIFHNFGQVRKHGEPHRCCPAAPPACRAIGHARFQRRESRYPVPVPQVTARPARQLPCAGAELPAFRRSPGPAGRGRRRAGGRRAGAAATDRLHRSRSTVGRRAARTGRSARRTFGSWVSNCSHRVSVVCSGTAPGAVFCGARVRPAHSVPRRDQPTPVGLHPPSCCRRAGFMPTGS